MAIVHRRGSMATFDPNKLVAGEFAYVLDVGELYYCYSPGNVKKIATFDDMVTNIDEALEQISEAYLEQINNATTAAEAATDTALDAAENADIKAAYAYEKGQEAQTIVDSAAPIINTNLQATYADKGTITGSSVHFPTADNGLVEITNIQGKYSQVVTVQGKQLFDKAKITAVKYIQPATGVVTNSSFNNNVSPLIPVTAGQSYTISGHAFVQPNTPVGVAWYNASGVYISGTSYQISNGNGTYMAPAGAAYARYTINNVDLNTSQFEAGSSATSYATYIPNSPSPDYPSVIHNAGDVPFDVGANNGLGLSNTKTISDMVLSAVPDGTKDEFISDGITAKVITRTRLVTKSSGAVSFTDIGNGNIRSGIVLESYATSGTSPVLLSAVCDKLSSGTSSPTVANTFSVQQHQDWTGVRASICIPASYLTSQNIAGVNAWLALNPITIRYAFVTPLKPAIETAHDRIFVTSYPGTTNVYTTDPLQPTFTAVAKSELRSNQILIDIGLKSLQDGKINKTDIVNTDTVNDTTKVASAAVARALGIEIDTLNNYLTANTSIVPKTSANLLTSLTTPNDTVRRYEYLSSLPADIPSALTSPVYIYVELIGMGGVRVIKISSVTSGGGIEHIDGYFLSTYFLWSNKY